MTMNVKSRPATAAGTADKIVNAIIKGDVAETKLKKLLDKFSPDERLAISKNVVDTLGNFGGTDATELRGLASRLDKFGGFVVENRGTLFPQTHHAYWMNASNTIERKANALDGLDPDAGVSSV